MPEVSRGAGVLMRRREEMRLGVWMRMASAVMLPGGMLDDGTRARSWARSSWDVAFSRGGEDCESETWERDLESWIVSNCSAQQTH